MTKWTKWLLWRFPSVTGSPVGPTSADPCSPEPSSTIQTFTPFHEWHITTWPSRQRGSIPSETRSTTLKLMVHKGSIFKLWVRVRVRRNIFKQTWTNPAAHRDTFIWHLIFKSIVVINNLTWIWVFCSILETICSSDVAHLSFFSSLLIFNANSNKTITIIRRRGYVRKRSLNRNGVIRKNDLDGRVVGLRGSAREDDLSGICSDQISHLLLRAKGNPSVRV